MEPLVKDPGEPPAPSTTRGPSEKTAAYELGSGSSPDTESAGTLTLNFQPLEL